MTSPEASFEKALRELHPDLSEDRVDRIIDFINDELVYEVEVPGARVGVTVRNIGGLLVTFDTVGNAVSVEFPIGGMVL